MTKYVWIIFLFAAIAQAVPTPPSNISNGTETGLFLRAFKDVSNATLMAELGGINETSDRDYREVTLGAYHDISDNFSVGVFYRRAYGLRHDNDWQPNDLAIWGWRDTNSRAEDFMILDATARAKVPGESFENVVAEFKMRLLHDFFNGEETLLLRPGLTYFWFKDEEPFMNFFLQYENDLPLNYGRNWVYERWVYLGALYHASSDLDAGGFIADKWQAWGNASAYDNKGGSPFFVHAESTVLSALLIWHTK